MKRDYLKLIICLLVMLQGGLACGQQSQDPESPEKAEKPFELESLELEREFDFGDQSSGFLTTKSWEALGKKDWEAVLRYTQKCIDLYKAEAKKQQRSLNAFPPQDKQSAFGALNNVGTCYFIQAEALMRQERWEESRRVFQFIIDNFKYAQCWDPRGWFWKVAKVSQESIDKINKLMRGEKITEEETKAKPPASKLVLFDPGAETIVNYTKYGKFENIGTKDYRYVISDQAALARAVGEGIYPNTTSVRKDPGYIALKGSERLKGEHWDFLYTDDMQANFYKWNMATEPQGVKQFYIALVLERAGLITQAIKAYYAIVMHFPKAYGWTYWHTPWYIGPVAIHKINYLTRHHPQLGMKLVGAKIKVENSFDNDIRNDEFICTPGKLVKASAEELVPKRENLSKLKIVQRIAGERVQLVKYQNGHWQLKVSGKPFPVRAVTYAPTKVGQSPDEGTLGNWMEEDFNQNRKIDGPYDAWVDKNGNNIQDKDEPVVGDFQLMRQMGINSIRLYHHPPKVNREVLSDLYKNYGIMTIMGDFLGAYTIGSGASWYDGTDYSNPEHQKNMRQDQS